MVEPGVVVLSVTDLAVVYVPAAGETEGMATFISYTAAPTGLDGTPDFQAFAFKVCDALTTTLPPEVTVGSDSVGVLPFCV